MVKSWHVPPGLWLAVIIVSVLFAGSPSPAAEAEAKDYDADDYCRMGQACLERGEYEEALQWYERGLALEPEDAELNLGKVGALAGLGRSEEAKEHLLYLYELDPDDWVVQFLKGYFLAGMDRPEEALVSYDRALELYEGGHPSLLRDYDVGEGAVKASISLAYVGKAEVSYELGRFEDALACYDDALKLYDGEFPDLLSYVCERKIKVLTEMGRLEEAVAAYDEVLALKPDYSYTHYKKGEILVELGRLEEAVAAFDRAIELRPREWLIHQQKAEILVGLGRYEEAVESYAQVLEFVDDEYPYVRKHAYEEKIKALKELGRLEEALETYDEALKRFGEDEDLGRGKGEVLLELGRHEEAVEIYSDIITLENGSTFEDRCRPGIDLLKSERYLAAIAYFEALAESEPEHGYPYLMIGHAWLGLEQYERAVLYFDIVSETAPYFAPARAQKGWALALMGQYETGLERARKALLIDASDPRTWTITGRILLLIGEAETARECFDCALKIKPDSRDAWTLKGLASYMQGEYAEARAIFERYPGRGSSRRALLYSYVVDKADGLSGIDRLEPLLDYPRDSWYEDVSLFLVGRTSAEDLLTRADDDVKLCEAHFYIGYKTELEGDAGAARRHFEEAVATEKRQCFEYTLALHELRRSGVLPAPSVPADALALPFAYAPDQETSGAEVTAPIVEGPPVKGPVKGRVETSPPDITGAAAGNSLRSSAVIARIVNQRKAGLEYIYKEYLKTDPDMEGKLVVRFTVAASGAVTACSVVSSTLGNAAMEREVCARIGTWRFPPIDAGDVAVVYPFVFYAAGAK